VAAGALAAAVAFVAACGPDADSTVATGSSSTDPALPAAGPPAVTKLSGALFYYPTEPRGEATVTSWAPEVGQPAAALSLAAVDALSSATFAPDGKRVAWVKSDFESGSTELFVASVDGSGAHVLLKEADPYCVQPSWSGDGTKLLTRPAAESSARSIDVATATLSTFATPIEGCHLLWSADGGTIAFSLGPAITLAKADGSNRRNVPKLGADGGPTQRRSHDPMSLSSDGRLLALKVLTGDSPDGDVGRDLEANEIVDTVTGATMALPVSGQLKQAYFLPAGGVVVRVKAGSGMEIALLSADLKLITKVAEPPELASLALLGYGG
jgi:TolB protein